MSDIVAQLRAAISLDSAQFDRGIRSVSGSLRDIARGAGGAGGALSGMDQGMKTAASGAGALRGALSAVARATVVLGLVDVGKQAVETAVKFQGYSKSLEATLGSSQRVAKEMKDLKEIAKLPGIGLEESIQSFQRFVAVGAKTDLAKNLISGLGKLNAVSGGTVENFNEAGRQFSQIMSAGKITEENLGVIKERLPAFSKLMKETFGTSTAEGLKDAGVSVDTFVAKMSDAMGKTKGVTETAQNSFDNLQAASTDALNSIGTMLLPAVTGGITAISDVLTKASDGLTAFASSSNGKELLADLTAGFNSFKSAAVSVGTTVTSALSAIGVSVKSGDILAGIKAFGDGFRVVGAAVSTFAKSEQFKTFVTGIAQGAHQVVESLRPVVAWFQTNMPLIQKTVQTVVNFITTFWAAHGSQIMAIVGPVYGQIKDVIVTVVATIGNVIKLAMQVITGDWKGAGSTIKAIVSSLASFIGRSFTRIGEIVISFGRLLISSLADAAGRAGKAAIGIGAAIIDGIGGAIRSGASRVVGVVTDLGADALAAIRKKLGIASPSKEFHKVGAFSVEGMVQGMGIMLPSLVALAEKIGETSVTSAAKARKKALDQQTKSFTSELAKQKAMLAELMSGGTDQDGNLAKRYNLVSNARRDEMASIKSRIAGIQQEREAQEALTEAVKAGKAALLESANALTGNRGTGKKREASDIQALADRLGSIKSGADGVAAALQGARIADKKANANSQDLLYLEFFGVTKSELWNELARISDATKRVLGKRPEMAGLKQRIDAQITGVGKGHADEATDANKHWGRTGAIGAIGRLGNSDWFEKLTADAKEHRETIEGLNREYRVLLYTGSEWGKFLTQRTGTDFEAGIDPDRLKRLREEFVALTNVAQGRGLENLRDRLIDMKIQVGEITFKTTEAKLAWENFHTSVDKLTPDAAAEVRKLAGEFDKLNEKAKKLEGIRQAGQTIKTVFANAFETVLTTGKNFFQSLVDGFRQAIIRILAEKAAAAVAGGAEGLLKDLFGLNKKEDEGGNTGGKGTGSTYNDMSAALESAKRTPTPVIVSNPADLGAASASNLAPLLAQFMPRAGGAGMPGMGGGGLAGSVASWGIGQAFGAAAGAATAGIFPIVDGLFGGQISKGIGKLFGGLFADGGTLGAGKWGIAGERGPELIYSGSSPMTIKHNRDTESIFGMGGGDGGAVNFNGTVNISDAADVRRITAISRARKASRFRLA